jgi:hypothetical protein
MVAMSSYALRLRSQAADTWSGSMPSMKDPGMLGAAGMAFAYGSGTDVVAFFVLNVSEQGVIYAYSGTQ